MSNNNFEFIGPLFCSFSTSAAPIIYTGPVLTMGAIEHRFQIFREIFKKLGVKLYDLFL